MFAAVKNRLGACFDRARAIVAADRVAVKEVAFALEVRGHLDTPEIDALLARHAARLPRVGRSAPALRSHNARTGRIHVIKLQFREPVRPCPLRKSIAPATAAGVVNLTEIDDREFPRCLVDVDGCAEACKYRLTSAEHEGSLSVRAGSAHCASSGTS